MTQNNLKNIKQLTNYLSQQQNSSYTPTQIKEIAGYVRIRALRTIDSFYFRNKSLEHICSQYRQYIKQIFNNNKSYTFTKVGKGNQYAFKQIIDDLKAVQNKMNDFKIIAHTAINNNQVVVNNVLDAPQTNQVNNQDIQHQNVGTQPNQNNNINEQQNNNQTEQQHQTQMQNIDDDMDLFFDDNSDNNRNNAFHLDFEIFDENVIQDNQGQQFYDDNLINLNNDTNQINNTNTMYPFITKGNNI